MEHFATHKLSKTSTSLPSKVSDSIHCGSASWITNGNGTPVQHLQYMPYGEPLVNERKSSYEERFTFTGKERDSETGFSYFGARYYDSDLMTGWLSVDPMADKYPNLSPYAYCEWNPIGLIDTNGMEYGGWDKFKRYASGGLNIAAGGFTVLGGAFVGAGLTVFGGGPLGFTAGAFMISTGAYEISQGIHKITNAVTDMPESRDPQYTTPIGEMTDCKTADLLVSVVVGYGPDVVDKVSKITKTTANTVKNTSKVSDESRVIENSGTIITTIDISFPYISRTQKDNQSRNNKNNTQSKNNKVSQQNNYTNTQIPFM